MHTAAVVYVVASGDLPQTTDAGQHLRVQPKASAVFGELSRHNRTRPHHTHLAAQHIPQLGQLVETRLAQKPAYTGDPRILPQLVSAGPFGGNRRVVLQMTLQ